VPELPVNLSSGLPETRLDTVATRWPRYLDAWARLGSLQAGEAEAYACYRVGYHRGLDQLRQSGWRGQGYVRWAHAPNRGFLRSLAGMARVAGAIGEHDEAERCLTFVSQLDPLWDGADS